MKCKLCKEHEVEDMPWIIPEAERFTLKVCYDCRNTMVPTYLHQNMAHSEAKANYIRYIRLYQEKYL